MARLSSRSLRHGDKYYFNMSFFIAEYIGNGAFKVFVCKFDEKIALPCNYIKLRTYINKNQINIHTKVHLNSLIR